MGDRARVAGPMNPAAAVRSRSGTIDGHTSNASKAALANWRDCFLRANVSLASLGWPIAGAINDIIN